MSLFVGNGIVDDADREEWDRLFRARTQRLLPDLCLLDLTRMEATHGRIVFVTLAEDPPEFAHRIPRQSAVCPVCGLSTDGQPRRGVTLDVTFERGFNCGIGAWAHRSCYDACTETGIPRVVPW
jgi:hypothetical protein